MGGEIQRNPFQVHEKMRLCNYNEIHNALQCLCWSLFELRPVKYEIQIQDIEWLRCMF